MLVATISTFGSDALNGGSQISLLVTTAVCIFIGMAFYRIQLYRLGNQVCASSEDAQIYILAATNGSKHAVMLANYSDDTACEKQMRLNLSGCDHAKCDIYLVDEAHDFTLVDAFEGTCKDITLPANAMMFLTVEA